jgi:hypothetical protein
MEEIQSANELRAPPRKVAATDEASIDALPDAMLQHCFSLAGKHHYHCIALTSHCFYEVYHIKHEKKTTYI